MHWCATQGAVTCATAFVAGFAPDSLALDAADLPLRAAALAVSCLAIGLAVVLGRDAIATVATTSDEPGDGTSRSSLALECSDLRVWDWSVPRGVVTIFVPRAGAPGGLEESQVTDTAALRGAIHPDDRRRMLDQLRAHVAGRASYYDAEYRVRDGERWRWVHDRGRVTARDHRGRARRLVGTQRDVSVQKAMEAQLRQSQKLESIGALAAGIAHEINTPTQYVGDNVHFLKDAFEELLRYLEAVDRVIAEDARAGLDASAIESIRAARDRTDLAFLREEIPRAILQSEDGVTRVSRIVRAMKEFSHPGTSDKEPVDINRAIESTVTVARNEWKYVADLELALAPDLPPVPCLPGEINQVVLNLIINAAQAIAERIAGSSDARGRIDVSTRRLGDRVEIRIRDTGNGIPEDIRERVFDPFFTTKEVGKGTGQGLAIARSVVVDKHGGRLDFDTVPGEGTVFVIELPLIP